jgi:pantoate--beta-alanine ligase
MQIISTQKELKAKLDQARQNGQQIGFVPTMGALHAGHASLVKRARSENQLVVASVFVNPTQFNDKKDLEKYPRTPETDATLLESSGCDILFMPNVTEMYPANDSDLVSMDLNGLDRVMEGAHRPGHFAGVVTIVSKLFAATGSCKAYFGEKDFQQVAIIRYMVNQLQIPVEIIGCPTLREADGLAMSSRNMRLTNEERIVASEISQALFYAKEIWLKHTASEVKDLVIAKLSAQPLFRIDYFEIADADTLQTAKENQRENVVACVALHLGAVRLIDNVLLG